MSYTNSKLVEYTRLSPNNSGTRTHAIDRITPHCVVGQCTIETLGAIFAPTSRQASSNYGIDKDGRVGMFVPESKRSWCSSSNANDQRAITIEVASDSTSPYGFRPAAYKRLIELCADICRRNGKTKLLWIPDKNKALAYTPKSNEMLLTVHRWFANKSCPGDWMMAHMDELATQVTKMLGSSEGAKVEEKKVIKCTSYAEKKDLNFSGTYTTTSDLNLRQGPGMHHAVMTVIPKGAKVKCYGYYTYNDVTWLNVRYETDKVIYEGFASKLFLK